MHRCPFYTKFVSLVLQSLLMYAGTSAQDIPNQVIEQQFENIAEAENSETEDDSYQQQLQQLMWMSGASSTRKRTFKKMMSRM